MAIKETASVVMEDLRHPPSLTGSHQPANSYPGSPTLSSSSGVSFSFPSEMGAGMEDEDLFWGPGPGERSGDAVFCPSTPMSPAHHRLESDAFNQYSQDSPTKAGGIPIELALFSDDEEAYTGRGRMSSLEAHERTPMNGRSGTNAKGKSLTCDGRLLILNRPIAGRAPDAVSSWLSISQDPVVGPRVHM
jgi:hypothetical protein